MALFMCTMARTGNSTLIFLYSCFAPAIVKSVENLWNVQELFPAAVHEINVLPRFRSVSVYCIERCRNYILFSYDQTKVFWTAFNGAYYANECPQVFVASVRSL